LDEIEWKESVSTSIADHFGADHFGEKKSRTCKNTRRMKPQSHEVRHVATQ
jgi:hypothetical protein